MKVFKKARARTTNLADLRKYMWYSLGEIVLIAVGISLATWFGERNESFHASEIEYGILKEIRSDLIFDLEEIEKDILDMDRIINSCSQILNFLENDEEYKDSLNYHFAVISLPSHFNPNTGGYALLESKGIELVSNDKLRLAITELYLSEHVQYGQYQDERIDFVLNQIEPIFIGRFYNVKSAKFPFFSLIPIEPEKLKHDQELISKIQFVAWRTERIKTKINKIRTKILTLDQDISTELESR